MNNLRREIVQAKYGTFLQKNLKGYLIYLFLCAFFYFLNIYFLSIFMLYLTILPAHSVIDLIFFTENSFMRICIYSFDCTQTCPPQVFLYITYLHKDLNLY